MKEIGLYKELKTSEMKADEKVIFFDGHCNLCNGVVQFIIKRDKERVFKFASLQSEAAEELNLKEESLRTMYFKEGVKIWSKSDAALKIFKNLNFPWKIAYGLIIFPRQLRDYVYDIISKYRYRWFGKSENCMMPTPELEARFLK